MHCPCCNSIYCACTLAPFWGWCSSCTDVPFQNSGGLQGLLLVGSLSFNKPCLIDKKASWSVASATGNWGVKCEFCTSPRNPLVTSCSSDVQNCGEMRSLHVAVATSCSSDLQNWEVKCEFFRSSSQPSRHFVLVGRPKLWGEMRILGVVAHSSFRAHRTSKTVVKRKFWSGRRNPLVTSCWSDVPNCGEMVIFVCRGLPRTSCAGFIHFCARRCSETCILKFWMARRDAHCFCWMNPLVGFGGSIARICGETQIFCGNCRKHRAKRSFWKYCSIWNLEEALHETIAVTDHYAVATWETCLVTIGFSTITSAIVAVERGGSIWPTPLNSLSSD